MSSDELQRAQECRTLASDWRERAAERVGEERRLMLEVAGQYEKLAFQLERLARLPRAQAE
jgi:hypothetical protein